MIGRTLKQDKRRQFNSLMGLIFPVITGPQSFKRVNNQGYFSSLASKL